MPRARQHREPDPHSERQALFEVSLEVGDGHTDLLHRVAVADRDAAVIDGLEVVSDAERSTDLIFAAVPFPDGTGDVIVHHEVLGQLLVNFGRLLVKLLGQRQDGSLVRCQCRVETHDDAGVFLALRVGRGLFVVSFAQERENHAVGTEGRLDDVRNVLLVGRRVEVVHVLTGEGLVLGQVVVGTVGNAPEFAPAEREQVLEVGGRLGVERQLFRLVVTQPQVFGVDVEGIEPIAAVPAPVLEPLKVCTGLAEELEFHLLELTGTEGEVSGRDLVAEGLTDLADTERHLFAGGPLDVLEVDENALRGLGPQVQGGGGVFRDALEGLEHQVELTDVREVLAAAFRAGDVVVGDVLLHLLEGHGLCLVVEAVRFDEVFDEVVRAVAGMAVFTVHERVGETADVAGRFPDFRVHEDGGVEADIVFVLLDEFLPPGTFDVVLQFDAEGAVVPAVGEAAVNVRTRENEPAVLAQRDDLIHRLLVVFHCVHSCSIRRWLRRGFF